jgi:hypothetical protein
MARQLAPAVIRRQQTAVQYNRKPQMIQFLPRMAHNKADGYSIFPNSLHGKTSLHPKILC